MFDYFGSFEDYSRLPVNESSLFAWNKWLRTNAVVSKIDKDPSDFAICCPCGYQLRTHKYFTDELVSFTTPPLCEVQRQFRLILDKLRYTGIKVSDKKIENHRFGPWPLLPKCSDLVEKDRPLGSYFTHAMGKHYLLASRAIDSVTHQVCKAHNRDIGVMKFAKIIQDGESLNLSLGERSDNGWNPRLFPWKRDLDNFFNRVTRSQVNQAWQWSLREFCRICPRRKYLSIPISKFVRRDESRCVASHTRSFHEVLRHQFLHDFSTRTQNCPNHADDRWVIKLEDIELLFNLDFKTGILMFGKKTVLPVTGCTQGSRLSPALCLMVCRWIESTCMDPERPLAGPFVKFVHWFRRWMDDIFGVVIIYVARKASAEDLASIDDCVKLYLDKLLLPYERQFLMKVEDPDIFVGMKVFADDSSPRFMPEPTIRLTPTCIAVQRFKFQHWSSSSEVMMKLRIVISQICQVTDRTSSELLLIRAIANLVMEFRAVSFPWPVIRRAFGKFLKQHPYLKPVLEGLARAFQVETLFARAGHHFYFAG